MTSRIASLSLRKMRSELVSPVKYFLSNDDNEDILVNDFLGCTITLNFTGVIQCINCQRSIKKTFNQGYCYPCFKSLARCDTCIIKPEQCHYEQGTCREPSWGEEQCFQDHFVYLANSSGLKVGITRGNQIPTRWIDQGAIQALPIARVANRLQSGLFEVALKEYVADKTNWRAMLKGDVDTLDMFAERDILVAKGKESFVKLQTQFGVNAIQLLDDSEVVAIDYPVDVFPTKVTSLNLDKMPIVGGVLNGIKGQYLIFDTGVINIRKFAGYHVELHG